MNVTKHHCRCRVLGSVLIVAAAAMRIADAQDNPPPITPDTMAQFADAFFENELDRYPIPGVAFIAVNGEGVLYLNGYGVADRERQIPVDAAHTVFRAGSVSKSITSAAVLLLAHEGRIDLDASIDDYITSIRVPQPFGPIRVRNLLTHTAGFDDTIIGMHERDQAGWLPLADYLSREMPPPAMPPDQFISYSSWDFALAGLLIEDVTGQPYAEFIDRRIFSPLGMNDSSFALPDPPSPLMERLAGGYNFIDGAYKRYPFDYIKASPGIAMLTTARDMGHFLMAQLNGGLHKGTSALPEAVIAQMQTAQFTNHPILRGFTHGFAEWKENDLDALFHDGNAIGHSSRVFLLPDHDFGFFVAYNTVPFGPGGVPSDAGRLSRRLTSALLDHFFPVEDTEPTPPSPMPGADTHLARFAGHYRQTNYSRHTFQKIISLLEQVRVTANDDGTLTIGSSNYVQIEPNLFQFHTGSNSYVPFREDESGAITHLHFGTGSYERVPAIASAPVQMGLFAGFLLLFFAAVLSYPLRLLGRLRGKPWGFGWPVRCAFGGAVLNLLFLIGLARLMTSIDTMELFAGIPLALKIVLLLPVVSALLTAISAAGLVHHWRNAVDSLPWRLWHTAAVLGLAGFVPFLHYWNLLAF